MKLFGREGDRETFRKLTGHPQQLVGCELFESLDGEMRSQRVMRIRNGEIELEILLDRGFDIGRLLFRGVPMQWVSPAGFRHPHSLTPTFWLCRMRQSQKVGVGSAPGQVVSLLLQDMTMWGPQL